MASERLGQLETRIRGLVASVHELRARNTQLEHELKLAKDRLSRQIELAQQWEEERSDIRARIEKVLCDLEFFECLEEATVSKEVALD